MTELAIEVENLSKSYSTGFLGANKKRAVDEASFSVPKGKVSAFIGPNGAGKTTTLQCLLGFLRPDQGQIEILSEDADLKQYRRRIGFSSEIFNTYPFLTAREVLSFYGQLSGLSKVSLENQIPIFLQKMGLQDAQDQRVKTFSKGMLQRLGLAQSLLHDPELIIWDEPSSGLDPEGRKLVSDLLVEEREKGKTILLSTHILSDVEKLCDYVLIIREGKIMKSGPINELLQESSATSLEELYLGTGEGVKNV